MAVEVHDQSHGGLPASIWQKLASEFLDFSGVSQLASVNQFLHSEFKPHQQKLLQCKAGGLPPALWALIASNYLSFQDVRNLMSVNSFFRHEIALRIQRLFVFRHEELNCQYAKKFLSCSQVFIYSLTSLLPVMEEQNDEDDFWVSISPSRPRQRLSPETVAKVVPFLRCFQQLKFVHLGGYNENQTYLEEDNTQCDMPYNLKICESPENHKKLFENLLGQLADAFRDKVWKCASGETKSEFHLSGVLDPDFNNGRIYQLVCSKNDVPDDPQLCYKICYCFPLRNLVMLAGCHMTLTEKERYQIVYQRDKTYFAKSEILYSLLRQIPSHSLNVALPPVKIRGSNVYQMRDGFGMAHQPVDEILEMIDFLCRQCGCLPSEMDADTVKSILIAHQKSLYKTMRSGSGGFFEDANDEDSGDDETGYHYYMKEDFFRRLTKLGFPIREAKREGTDGFQLINQHPKNPELWVRNMDVPKEKQRCTSSSTTETKTAGKRSRSSSF